MSLLQQFKDTAASKGGVAWIEELLVRGRPPGENGVTVISGAHVVFGWKAPGVPGAEVGGIAGPYDLAILATDPEWAALVSELNLAALDQVNALQAQVQTLQAQVESLQEQIATPAE